MDFARKELMKFGWKEGKGLGKNESGISEAVKPKLKYDNAGIGHNASDEFTYPWWENVFNKAANNIFVEETNEGIKVKSKGDKINMTTSKYYINASERKRLKYGSFMKKSTLTNDGKSVPVASSFDETRIIENTNLKHLSDEELYKACGGLTAHKGARHGLKLNGKLKRIKEQEETILGTFIKLETQNGDDERCLKNSSVKKKTEDRKLEELMESGLNHHPRTTKNKRKKKKLINLCDEDDDNSDINYELQELVKEETCDVKKRKKAKKKKKIHMDADFEECLTVNGSNETENNHEDYYDNLNVNISEHLELCRNIKRKNKFHKQDLQNYGVVKDDNLI